jgi:REP element-mobilizing transposase RayT
MILAYHVIFSAYGFWLPNDPRGSWSTFVAAWELLLAGGKATKTIERRSLAHDSHDRSKRLRTKAALKYPPVNFSGEQALSVAKGFAEAIADGKYIVHACSILPEHVHLVTGRHERDVERIVGHLKSSATKRLDADGLHPFAGTIKHNGSKQSPWSERCWKVFLDSPEDVPRAIRYVEQNPVKEGKKRQQWSFVRPLGD